jgi:cellulose synthase (UDP-forming)
MITGRLDRSRDPVVRFRRVATVSERVRLTVLVLLNLATATAFVAWLLLPAHIPGHGIVGLGGQWRISVARFAFCIVVVVELIRATQNFAIWVFSFAARDPVPKALPAGLRVALLTTIVPSKEPIEVAERTLSAMLQVAYRGQVDVWILDEGDDPAVKAMAARLGVRHFSRKGRPEFNRSSGPYRAKTKAGNHNAWRAEHEHRYDVVAQMDPDHVPLPCFLERTLGYFRDPDVAFVVAPQVYGNMYDNWVTHGASVQQYLFSGVVERAGNGMNAPLLIGTNHLYRPRAWEQIGGYQDSIIEDHLTGMRMQGTVNDRTGNQWKGVYTPDVLAIGEAPSTWTDYFNQQKRWSYGIWQILLNRKMRDGIELTSRQRMLFGLVRFYYPSVGVTVLFGSLATAIYLLLGVTALQVNGYTWVALWSANMGTWLLLWFWLRRFNLAKHERRELGLPGILLALFAGPVYLAAGARAVLRRPLRYVVTAKGALRSGDSARTFTLHMYWAFAAAALLAISYRLNHDLIALRIWASVALLTGIGPPLIAGGRWLTRVRAAPADSPVRDTHAWQQHMADEITAPAFQVLFDMADAQAQQVVQYPEQENVAPWHHEAEPRVAQPLPRPGPAAQRPAEPAQRYPEPVQRYSGEAAQRYPEPAQRYPGEAAQQDSGEPRHRYPPESAQRSSGDPSLRYTGEPGRRYPEEPAQSYPAEAGRWHPEQAAQRYPAESPEAYPERRNRHRAPDPGPDDRPYPKPNQAANHQGYPDTGDWTDHEARPRDKQRMPRHASPGRHR